MQFLIQSGLLEMSQSGEDWMKSRPKTTFRLLKITKNPETATPVLKMSGVVPHLLSLTETDLSVVRVNTSALRNEAFWVPLRMFERVCLQRLLHVVSPRFTPL